MLEKIKRWKPLQGGIVAISLVLVAIAETSASTSTFAFWHEPDCPEELLK